MYGTIVKVYTTFSLKIWEWYHVYLPCYKMRVYVCVSKMQDQTSVCSLSEAILGLYSLNGKTSYRKISWSLEAAGFGSKLFQSLWNLVGTSAALLPRCLSNFRAIRPLQHTISWLRDFTRFGGKTSYRLVNRGPGYFCFLHAVSCPDIHWLSQWTDSKNNPTTCWS